jgi:hypothetical protein
MVPGFSQDGTRFKLLTSYEKIIYCSQFFISILAFAVLYKLRSFKYCHAISYLLSLTLDL